MTKENDFTQKREHFRLDYPKPERPALKIKSQSFEVMDLSEKGIKFYFDDSFNSKESDAIKGLLVFKDGTSCEISGRILRIHTDTKQCIVHLNNSIPYAKMLEEQRRILQRYKS